MSIGSSFTGSAKGIALFDLDYTLLGGDATYEWIHFLIDLGVLDRGAYEGELERFYDEYAAGTLDIHEFLHFDFRPLASNKRAHLEQWRARYLAEIIAPIMLPKARDLIAWHRARGNVTAIITAANSFVSTPIATMFGVEHLLASIPESRDGEFTGKIEGIPCFHEGKVIKLDVWLAGRGQALTDFAESYFYGDSQSDVPLMEKVTHPVAVEPDDALAELARARNWPIISLR
jgi:HAD superfamily hydrolase (TIGR01490 family)